MSLLFPNWLTQRGKRIIQELQQGRISIPVPVATLTAVVRRLNGNDPSISDLELSIAQGARLIIAGRKKLGPWWIPFTATFMAHPPENGAPPHAIDLSLERTSPAIAYPFALRALASREGLEMFGSRVRIDIGQRINQQDWARYLPYSVLNRIRVVAITSDAESRQLMVTLAAQRS